MIAPGRSVAGRTLVGRNAVVQAAAPSAFDEIVADQYKAAQFLVEVEAFRGGEIRLGGGAPVGRSAVGRHVMGRTLSLGQESASTVSLRYGDRHWTGDPDDTDRPNAYYEGRLLRPLRIERAIPTAPEQNPRIQRQFGEIEIANNDGGIDAALTYAVDGREVRVLYGPAGGAYADFKSISSLLATRWRERPQSVELLVRDRRYALDQPLQTNLYAGTGGAEGTDDLEGKPIPLAFGVCRNVAPVLVDPVNLIFQFHDGQAQAVDAVYDRAAALSDSGTDVSGYANLAALSVAGGEFATALDAGLIKLGSSPDGQVTADVKGDADPQYEDTIDPIVLRILTTYAGLSESVINTASLAGLVATGGSVGWSISVDERPSTAQVLDALIAGVAGFWGTGRDGRVRAGRLTRPESRQPVFFFDQWNTLDVEPLEQPAPRYRQRVGYQRIWTVQQTDIAGAVGDDRRQVLAQPQRTVASLDTTVRTRHPEALDPEVMASPLDSESDAQTLANALLDLHKRDRRPVRIRAKRIGFRFDLGVVVRLTWPRYGLEQGRNFVIVGSRDDGDTTELTLWG